MDSLLPLLPVLLLAAFGAVLSAGHVALTVSADASGKKAPSSSGIPAACRLGGFLCTACAAALGFLVLQPAVGGLLSALGLLALLLMLYLFCVLLPGRIARRRAQRTAQLLSGFCRVAALVFHPFSLLCGGLAGILALPFGVSRTETRQEAAAEEEIRMLVDAGEEQGAFDSSEKDMINNIFAFDDRGVSQVMTHRTDMTAVPETIPIDALAALAISTGFSRIPVYGEDIDDISGILYVKDLLQFVTGDAQNFQAVQCMRPALFVPENMRCMDLLAQFKQKKIQAAIAVDEYGGTAGIVSMEDLLESIVGNIEDEYDMEDNDVFKLSEDCYSLEGTVPIDTVEHLFGIALEDDRDCDTIGGLLVEVLECIPARDEHPAVTLSGVRFTVTHVENRRIARVRCEREPENPAN